MTQKSESNRDHKCRQAGQLRREVPGTTTPLAGGRPSLKTPLDHPPRRYWAEKSDHPREIQDLIEQKVGQ